MIALQRFSSTQSGPECPHHLLSEARNMFIDGFGSVQAGGDWLGYSRGVLSAQLTLAERHKLGLIDAFNASIATADPRIPKAWCAELGLATVLVPAIGEIGDLSLMCSFSSFVKEVGEVCRQFNDTMADNKVEAHEVAAMRKRALELIQALMVLIKRLEGMQE